MQNDEQPLRSELFSIDLLQRHARSLAEQHRVGAAGKGPNLLLPRLAANEKLLRAYNEQTLQVEKERRITPAAEWLLDNFHLIEAQIRTARRHLPRGFSRELPHLNTGSSASFPRVYHLAQELISHVDGRVDAPHLTSFIAAYQEVTALKVGELWAIPIMLRLALIENLRRVAALLGGARRDRDAADGWADRMLEVAESHPSQLIVAVAEMAQSEPSLSQAFVTEFWRRTQEKSPAYKLALSWIEERLAEEGQTIEQMVQGENQIQAANQVSVGNSISSLRFLDAVDWREFVESLSVVEQALRADPSTVYRLMDFATRDAYRHTVERIARHSKISELAVARLAVEMAQRHPEAGANRAGHVGYFLVDQGVAELERAARMKVPARSWLPRLARAFPLQFYLGSIGVLTLAVTLPLLPPAVAAGPPRWALAILALSALLAATQLAVSLVNWIATLLVQPRTLPRLDFSRGIPAGHTTMVVVPTMLTSPRGIENLLEAIEVRYLANRDDHLFFALLTDFRDAPEERLPGEEALVLQAKEGIERLNEKYQHDRPSIFYLFHRPRRWNPAERVWMGYERKRGKLAEFNRALRGGRRDCFSEIVGDVSLLSQVKYVITLDTDTQLPREAARQLAGAVAHPLNRPVYDADRGLIVAGYSILQPRVAVSLPSANRSRFVQLFSGEPGVDPYTRAVSDVYQDVFHEGSFIGKGIYDVDAFERAVGGRFPENRILSHDLLEGSYARSALISDVQLFEEFPALYTADTQRRHRWVRGDWQIASWLLPRVPGADVRRVSNPLTGLSRWKIFDNLRRSLVPVALTALLALGWTVSSANASFWSLFVVTLLCLPALLSLLVDLLRKPAELPLHLHLKNAGRMAARHLGQTFLTLMFLPYDAAISLDAVVRTLGRLLFSRRHLLQWQTASDSDSQSGTALSNFFATMWCVPGLALAIGLVLILVKAPSWTVALPFLLLWGVSPIAAWWISLPLREKPSQLSAQQVLFLQKLARKTWRYFETFVGPDDHWLPPDNFQEVPRPTLALRTSPTNIGMSLLCTLAAHDFGYLSMGQLMERVAQTLGTLEKLERYRGHFYNWYETRTLKALPPLYISTVDNGNLSGLLLTLRSGLLELVEQPWQTSAPFSGLRDTLQVWMESAQRIGPSSNPEVIARLEDLHAKLSAPPASLAESFQLLATALEISRAVPSLSNAASDDEFQWWRQAFERQCRAQRDDWAALCPWLPLGPLGGAPVNETVRVPFEQFCHELHSPQTLQQLARQVESRLSSIEALRESLAGNLDGKKMTIRLAELGRSIAQAGEEASRRVAQLEQLARQCDEFAQMDFTMLYDPSRDLFSIGYNVTHHRLDSSFYDLLASEARLASFVAIALGQVPQRHWFALGRLLTATKGQPTLISWSGSMFEYLMPLLIMPTYDNTLLDVSCKTAIARQIEYGNQLGVPWGLSESGYNLTDVQANYQYRAFGVPGLGFKRGLADDLVIAPYATSMSLMLAPREACRNLERLCREGAEGLYGFYEAIDYTASRLPPGQSSALVESFMAHHQGMALLALAYRLLDRPMQRRFQANPLFQSAALLLHERVPRETSVLFPHELEVSSSRQSAAATETTMRVFTNPNAGPPEIHLLSNGRYHVMITSAGGGYSIWNETALTRWREDPTRDNWGAFVYLRDVETGKFWSTAYQPTLQAGASYEAIFSQGRAEFRSRLHEIDSHTEISVSPEDDIEIRRVTLTNHSTDTRIIEVTSYAEVVLNTMAADAAHPAFNKLFIQTSILRRQQAVLCSRRPRSRGEQPPSLFNLMLVQGEETGKASYETDRSLFIGRGGDAIGPAALLGATVLSNSDGPVLDPIVSIRRSVVLGPNESARITLVAGIAATRAATMALIEKYQDQSIADRVFDLAWTHGMVTLRHLNATEADAQLYSRLAGALLYSQPLRRASSSIMLQNRRGQRNLWSFGISGDLPIVLLRCTTPERMDLVTAIVQAHGYWRLKGLAVDLVILNEDASVYRQSIHDQIMTLIASGIEAYLLDKPGGLFVRRADQLSQEDKILLQTVARVVLSDENGTLAEQLQRRARAEPVSQRLALPRIRAAAAPPAELPKRDLIFFNGLGGFTRDGREYVITLGPKQVTPAPWVNVLGNPGFGTLISESGGSYSWGENCHEFRLTPWNNDPVTDASGEAFYIRDEQTGQFWSPTPLPVRGQTPYVTRHGFGYTAFEHTEEGIASELMIYVAVDAPVKFALIKLRNLSGRQRQLSVTGYWEWVLGEHRQKNLIHIVTELDLRSGALLARNPYNIDFEGRVAFVTASEAIRSCTGDRGEFLGRNNTLANPAAMGRVRLSGKIGAGLDPCAVLQVPVQLAPDEEKEIVFKIGVGLNLEKAQHLIQIYRSVESCREALRMVWASWNHTLGAVQVETPDAALNVLANGWLLYQTISCRLWARTGFYQSGGAFGFRDQLQDTMALVHARPGLLREQLLRAAAHQFREGDVQHWWHPPSNRGVRTHFSDDYLWLPYATCHYVEALGDVGVLDEKVPFLEGRPVRPDEEAYFDTPQQWPESGTLYDHCLRAIKYGLKFGEHGLPLIGCGDWNDGMNLLGEQGRGESVWLGLFLYDVLNHFAVLARNRGDLAVAKLCHEQAGQLRENIEKNGWDGQWYRRAYFDNGEPLGSASNAECQIDSLPQSWAILSGAGDPSRTRTAMEAVAHRLVRREAKLIQLFDPPFDKSPLEPGYIKGYLPGVRENGGQYTHAAIWTVMAFAVMGDTARAWELFNLINPVLHAQSPAGVARYKVEPYVVAADVYSLPPHTGRGGWTWYTGSAGWMYRLIVDTLLGLILEGDKLRLAPRVPDDWKSFKIHYRYRETSYQISVSKVSGNWQSPQQVLVDGQEQLDGWIRLVGDRKDHQVEVRCLPLNP